MINMKIIQANSVGTTWRSDVFNASGYGEVGVVDSQQCLLGVVSQTATGKFFKLDGKIISFDKLWVKMHVWSDVIVEQQRLKFTVGDLKVGD
jgi:hypothetical protein